MAVRRVFHILALLLFPFCATAQSGNSGEIFEVLKVLLDMGKEEVGDAEMKRILELIKRKPILMFNHINAQNLIVGHQFDIRFALAERNYRASYDKIIAKERQQIVEKLTPRQEDQVGHDRLISLASTFTNLNLEMLKDDLAALVSTGAEFLYPQQLNSSNLANRLVPISQGNPGRDYFSDIRSRLNDDEAFVKIFTVESVSAMTGKGAINTYLNKFEFSNEDQYLAFIVTNLMAEPVVIQIPDSYRLQTDYFDDYLNNYMIRGNSFDFYNYDRSYDWYWKPIAQNLSNKVTRVYFQPEGVFKGINIGALQLPDHPDELVMDHTSVFSIFDTEQLFTIKKRPGSASSRTREKDPEVVFFNAPKFQLESNSSENSFIVPIVEEIDLSDIMINSFSNANWAVTEYNGKEATEANFKGLKRAPEVIHINTHRRYESTENLDLQKTIPFVEGLARPTLPLSGASDQLGNAVKIKLIGDDSFITGYEILQFNLRGTELVTLATCRSAVDRDFVQNNTYGLVEAFKKAGVKSLLVSLWNTDSYFSNELIGIFYQNWLQGNGKRQSLENAQNQMREKYPRISPFLWAGFIIIGED